MGGEGYVLMEFCGCMCPQDFWLKPRVIAQWRDIFDVQVLIVHVMSANQAAVRKQVYHRYEQQVEMYRILEWIEGNTLLVFEPMAKVLHDAPQLQTKMAANDVSIDRAAA